MKKLIRQIRSLGSLLKEDGVHVSFMMRKPEVSFKTPTYLVGGSNCSFTRQGGFIPVTSNKLLMNRHLSVRIRQAFMMEIMFLRGNINKISGVRYNNSASIKGFNYRLDFWSRMINFDQEVYSWHIFPAAS